jgi:uncharacterized protein (TIGR03066 family)
MILGGWRAVEGNLLPVGSFIELAQDKTVKLLVKDGGKESPSKGTYQIEGDKITLMLEPKGEAKTYTVKSDTNFYRSMKLEDGKDKSSKFERAGYPKSGE